MIYRAGNHETFNGGSRRHSPFGISKSGEIRVSLFTVGMKVNVLKATITGDLFKNYATSRSVIPVQDKISKVPVVRRLFQAFYSWLTFWDSGSNPWKKKSIISQHSPSRKFWYNFASVFFDICPKNLFSAFFIFFHITWSWSCIG